jgi:hypothetical protein
MADGPALASCPYCGVEIELYVDVGGGGRQRYVEDCAVCCRPIEVRASEDEDGAPVVELGRADD